jgi:hypothetical protein
MKLKTSKEISTVGEKLRKRQRFFQENPTCCFCGGVNAATTVDHVPPRACFPKDLMPEDFEFPACKECNNGTSKQDTIFGFCAMLTDFNDANRTPADIARFKQHQAQIEMRWPEALPDPASGQPIFPCGSYHYAFSGRNLRGNNTRYERSHGGYRREAGAWSLLSRDEKDHAAN